MADPIVRNAADPEQVKEGREKEKFGRMLELDDIRKILATDYGRRFVWRLLGKAGVFESVWRQSAEIHYLAGKQDFGHFIMGEVVESNPDALVLMMKEAKESDEGKKKKTAV